MRKCLLNFFILCGFIGSLAACGSDKTAKSDLPPPEERISVMMPGRAPTVDPSLTGFDVKLPEQAVNPDWAQNGGTVGHAPGHPALASKPKKLWSSSIGSGSGSRFKLLASPLIQGDVVYAMDSIGRIAAHRLSSGDRLWRVETTPDHRDGDAMGGGIALEQGNLYATTGFGEVVALKAEDGSILWRRSLGKPLRAAPTVFEGRLFALTIENETYALEAQTGQILWRHSGIAENAALMGASSAAVRGDTVVVAYSSGELFALRTQNGRVIWGEVLSVPTQKGALPAIADIRGLPVLEGGRIFAISHSGRMLSIDERSGGRVWESDIGGSNTPCVAGAAVFVLTNDNELVALARETGRIAWISRLQKYEKDEEKSGRTVVWAGPVLAGGKLWLVNSLGFLASYDPETGSEVSSEEISNAAYLPPIVAQRTMLVLSDDGILRAFK